MFIHDESPVAMYICIYIYVYIQLFFTYTYIIRCLQDLSKMPPGRILVGFWMILGRSLIDLYLIFDRSIPKDRRACICIFHIHIHSRLTFRILSKINQYIYILNTHYSLFTIHHSNIKTLFHLNREL